MDLFSGKQVAHWTLTWQVALVELPCAHKANKRADCFPKSVSHIFAEDRLAASLHDGAAC